MVGAPALLLAAAMAVRIWNAVAYDVRWQHDARMHLGYLQELAAGRVPASYNAPWHYLVTTILAAPVAVAGRLLGASDEAALRAGAGFAGTLLFAAFAAGCLAAGRALDLGERDARWYAALVCAFPVVARTYDMVRPENLILTLTPWALAGLMRWAPAALARPGKTAGRPGKTAGRAFWALAFLQAVMVAQKIGGAAVVATLPAFAIARAPAAARRRLLGAVAGLGLATAVLTVGLVAVQWLASGATPLRHDLHADPRFRAAPPEFFIAFDARHVWREPFRDAHRGSMPEILFIDLYGDYWRYGFDHARLGRAPEARLWRARAGILAGAGFVGLWMAGVALLVVRRLRRPAVAARPDLSLTAAALCPLAASAAYLGAAALRFYAPDDGDVAKWEYVVWVFVFLPIPMLQAARALDGRAAVVARAALAAVAVAGLAQSVVSSAL